MAQRVEKDADQANIHPYNNTNVLISTNYSQLNTSVSHEGQKSNGDEDHSWKPTDWLAFLKIDTMADLFSLSCSTAVIFGGLIPYIPQYLKIKRTKSHDGFSTYVCLTLLLANILRILFYFGHPFELPLLIQSFVMIIGMLLMMEICIRVKQGYTFVGITPINSINGANLRQRRDRTETATFWDWDNFLSYIRFLTLFTVMMGSLTYLLADNKTYVELLGFVAVLTESMLGVPQVSRNFRKKSTAGMSVEMVVMWLSGDIFKTTYAIVRKTPVQFYVCGAIQIIVDVIIISQVLWYRRPKVGYWRLPKSG